MDSYKGKKAVVTGGTLGIGLAAARALLDHDRRIADQAANHKKIAIDHFSEGTTPFFLLTS